ACAWLRDASARFFRLLSSSTAALTAQERPPVATAAAQLQKSLQQSARAGWVVARAIPSAITLVLTMRMIGSPCPVQDGREPLPVHNSDQAASISAGCAFPLRPGRLRRAESKGLGRTCPISQNATRLRQP